MAHAFNPFVKISLIRDGYISKPSSYLVIFHHELPVLDGAGHGTMFDADKNVIRSL